MARKTEDLGNGWTLTTWPKRWGRSWTEYEITQVDDRGLIRHKDGEAMMKTYCRKSDAIAYFKANS